MELIDYKLGEGLEENFLFSKLLHNAMLMNTHKDPVFLNKLMDLGIIRLKKQSTAKISQTYRNEFFKFLSLFEEKYKDNFDLGFTYKENHYYPHFRVIYPEFVISNSENETHTIKDLLVIHPILLTNGHVFTGRPLGGRLSMTDLEIRSGYLQSHLGSRSFWYQNPFNYISEFCVGGDTDVSRMLAEFEIDIDWDRYELYLFCVDSMVTWESLEGVPYIKMRTIQECITNKVNTHANSDVLKVVNTIIHEGIPLNLNFYIENNRFKIRPDEKADSLIRQVVLNKFLPQHYKRILVTRKPNTFDYFLEMRGSYELNQSFYPIQNKEAYILFRGRKVYPRILKEDKRLNKPVKLEDHIIHPNFLKDVLEQLECRIYEKAITKSRIKIQNSSSNAHRSSTSDTISV